MSNTGPVTKADLEQVERAHKDLLSANREQSWRGGALLIEIFRERRPNLLRLMIEHTRKALHL